MSIRKKTVLIISATFLGLVVVFAIGAHLQAVHGFERLERRLLRDNARRALGVFQDEESQLVSLVGDNAIWDDAWEFMRGQRTDFLEKNVTLASVSNLRVNAMLFLDPPRGFNAGKSFDLEQGAETVVPASLIAAAGRLAVALDGDGRPKGSEFLMLPEGPALLAAETIRRSDGSGPEAGWLVAARWLDDAMIERLSQRARIPLALLAPDDAEVSDSFRKLEDSDCPKDVVVRALTEDAAAAWTSLPDYKGEPGLILEARDDRAISRQGRQAATQYFILLTLSSLALILLALVLLEQAVLSRLSRLIARVGAIANQGDGSIRLGPQGTDEIGRLAANIDDMLESLERSETDLRRANEELERRVAERTAELALANDRLTAQAEELRERQSAIEVAAKSKSDFLATMSHEIRTPMTGVIGMLDLALTSSPTTDIADYLRMARNSADALLAIINDILDFSKIESGKMELEHREFALSSMIESVMGPMALVAREKGLRLSHSVDGSVPTHVVGDEGRLRQILVNVVGNALKFTNEGEVELTVRLVAEGDTAIGKPTVLFSVRDTGVGIPPDELETIFESFSQLGDASRAQTGGTGLGLAISKRLAEQMGGRIQVESAIGRGSVFSVVVGLETAPADAGEGRDADGSPELVADGLRILVAEDNLINQILIRETLERRGHVVVVTGNGAEALEALARERFDAALMDARMPVMSGEEAVRVIRRDPPPGVDPGIPVIALTAHALKGDRERFLAAGMDDYLSKPVKAAELDRALRKALAARRARTGPASREEDR